MNEHHLANIDLTRSLPPTLKQDPDMLAAAQVIGEYLQENVRMIPLNLVYHRLDELDEEKLDILAYDMHIDWYDDAFPIETKRQIIKDSVKVHKYLGTPYAVKTVLDAIFKGAVVHEWFEYGGRPYTFRIDMDISGTGMQLDLQRRIVRQMFWYKNLRSHLDLLHLTTQSEGRAYVGGYGDCCYAIDIPPRICTEYHACACAETAGLASANVEIDIPPQS